MSTDKKGIRQKRLYFSGKYVFLQKRSVFSLIILNGTNKRMK